MTSKEIETRNWDYRKMLSSLDGLLREDDLTRLKSFCKDYIGARQRDKISQGVNLFDALEERGKLSPDDLNFLKQALSSCCAGRSDVLDLVKDFEDKHAAFFNSSQQQGADMSDVFDFLENKLGKDYKRFLRKLSITDDHLERLEIENHHKVSDIIHKALVTWQKTKESASVDELVSALRAIRRNDLANRIADGEIGKV